MLVLTRRKRQTIVIGDPGGGRSWLLITVLQIARGRVQIGFTTTAVDTAAVPIHRGETWTGSGRLPGGTCQANGDGAAGSKATASIHSGSDDAAGVLGDSCRAARQPARSMHEVVAMARSRQRPAQLAVVSKPDPVADGGLR
jgi:sRNA-binding carbon storage regulator CsrA